LSNLKIKAFLREKTPPIPYRCTITAVAFSTSDIVNVSKAANHLAQEFGIVTSFSCMPGEYLSTIITVGGRIDSIIKFIEKFGNVCSYLENISFSDLEYFNKSRHEWVKA
jgi:hypothetical protein